MPLFEAKNSDHTHEFIKPDAASDAANSFRDVLPARFFVEPVNNVAATLVQFLWIKRFLNDVLQARYTAELQCRVTLPSYSAECALSRIITTLKLTISIAAIEIIRMAIYQIIVRNMHKVAKQEALKKKSNKTLKMIDVSARL
jgi:hypothetical protein